MEKGRARAALNEFRQQQRHVTFAWGAHVAEGPGHALTHTAELILNGSSFRGTGATRGDAQDAAAAAALDAHAPGWRTSASGAASDGQDRRALAYLGDAALELYVALAARAAGLDAHGADSMRQLLLSNAWLGRAQGGGGGGAGPAAATDAERRVGAAVLARAAAIAPLLREAVFEALPSLADDVERAAAARAAGHASNGSAAPDGAAAAAVRGL